MLFCSQFKVVGQLAFATSIFFISISCPGLLTGQQSPAQGSIQSGQNSAASGSVGRTAPAPWRPSFGTINRQSNSNQGGFNNPSALPARQRAGNPGGLAAPNSPYNQTPTGTNLETGQVTQLPVSPRANNPLSGNGVQSSTLDPSQSSLPPTANQQTLPPDNPSQNDPRQILPPTNQTLTSQSNSNSSTTASSNSPVNTTQGRFTVPNDQPLPAGTITRVTKTMKQLPNDAGQVWREYDISPYTSQIKGIVDPQQAILDWILKETGTELWFNQPLGILNADLNQVRVYHTPEIQDRVHRIIDRFVNTKGQVQSLQVSLVTIKKPNWRTAAYPVMQPIEVQSPGVEAWMLSKENAALLRASLARRGDFKDHGTGSIAQYDGQSVVLRNTRPVQFIRNFRWTGTQFPPYQPLMTTIDEGYTLEISSLTSLDGNTIEAAIECHVDQLEKLNTVKVEVPGTVGATTDRISLQIPQLVSWRLQERFRWSNDQVLLLSCGVVATPNPGTNLPSNLPGILGSNRQRADALLFIDYRGPELENSVPNTTARSRTVPVNPRR